MDSIPNGETPQSSPRFDKIVFLGVAEVGKSTLIKVIEERRFSSKYYPTKEDEYCIYNTTIDNTEHSFELWDVAGYIQSSAARDELILSGIAFVFVFSVVDRSSFDSLHSTLRHISKLRWEFKDLPMIIVGTKADLTDLRKVSFEDGKKLADQWSILYKEVQKGDTDDIENIMNTLLKQIKAYKFLRQAHPYKKPRCIIM